MMDLLIRLLTAFWWTLAEMSPYLLLGFAVAGALSVWISPRVVQQHLGGRGGWPVTKATLLGIPLPLCSCGVIPVAATLRQSGASRGATTSFLLSTPQTGVDSILATYGLLGPVFAVARPLVALITGLVGGAVVEAVDREATVVTPTPPPDESPKGPAWTRALRYGFVTLPGDLAWRLLIGLAIAAAIVAVAEPGALAPWLGSGIWAMLVMLVIGLPMYTCSAGAIPLAAGLMHLGLSPGAALVYLIAGPVTNAATIVVNWRVIGPRATVIYVATAMVGALAAGLALNALTAAFNWQLMPAVSHQHEHGLGIIDHVWAAALLAVMVAALVARRMPAAKVETALVGQTQTLHVEGMTCSHCVAAVTQALRQQPGVTGATVELASGRATVSGDELDTAAAIRAVEALGYRARPAG